MSHGTHQRFAHTGDSRRDGAQLESLLKNFLRVEEGGFYLPRSFVELDEIATPADPPADTILLYAKDVGGVSKLAYRDSAGTETQLGGGGASFHGCSIYRATSVQSLTNNVAAAVSWNTEDFDTDAFHDPGSNPTRVTIPTGLGGKYPFGATVVVQDAGTGTDLKHIEWYWKKNGSALNRGKGQHEWDPGDGMEYFTCVSSIIIDLAQGDYVELFVLANASGGAPTWEIELESQLSMGTWL